MVKEDAVVSEESHQAKEDDRLKIISTIWFGTLPTKALINMAFTLLSSHQARKEQPQVLDGDFISEE